MACKQPCFDCPFQRGEPKPKIADNDIFDFVFRHFTPDGGYGEYICEEQGEICFGQIQVMKNGYHFDMDPFSEMGEALSVAKVNYKDFYTGPWEFKAVWESSTDALEGG